MEWGVFAVAALISWAVNTALTPDPKPICYVVTDNVITPVYCEDLSE